MSLISKDKIEPIELEDGQYKYIFYISSIYRENDGVAICRYSDFLIAKAYSFKYLIESNFNIDCDFLTKKAENLLRRLFNLRAYI
jgi:hypothetical protein